MKRSSVIGTVVAITLSAFLGYFLLHYDLKVTPEETQTVQDNKEQAEQKSAASKGSKPQKKIEEQQKSLVESDLEKSNKSLIDNIIPEFDVVRVEKNGEALFAGRALADAKIIIERNGEKIASTQADETGAFVALPDKALSGDSNQIIIRSISPNGEEVLSKQVVAIGVTGEGEPLVALAEPDKPISILQKPDTVKPTAEEREVEVAKKQTDIAALSKDDNKSKPPLEAKAVEEPSAVKEENAQKELSVSAAENVTEEQLVKPNDSEVAETNVVVIDEENTLNNQVDETLEDDDINKPKQDDGNNIASKKLAENSALEKKRVARLVAEGDAKNSETSVVVSDDISSDKKVLDKASKSLSQDTLKSETKKQQADITAKKVPETVSVEAVEVDDEKLFIAGAGKKGQSVRVYIDDKPVGDIDIKENGRWLFEKNEELKPGQYKIRIDQLSKGDATVTARAEVPFVVEEKTQAEIDLAGGGSIIIRQNDNLWTIAQRVYGSGIRYTAIYEQNREQIRDPDLIFPGQIFNLPKLEKEPTSQLNE